VQLKMIWLTVCSSFRLHGHVESGNLNHCRSCTPAPEDEVKESPKHVRQK
jgi:hypothetical protein